MELALKADPAAETEPQALTSHPGLHPANILCSAAVRGSLAALDVGVTMPTGADGDADAAQLYLNVKLTKAKLEELTGDLVRRTLEPCKNCLRDAAVSTSEVDEVRASAWTEPGAPQPASQRAPGGARGAVGERGGGLAARSPVAATTTNLPL